jgi:NAD(P)-dependent dehydrogenase (short-subunit alcohol dehydrogenase family)
MRARSLSCARSTSDASPRPPSRQVNVAVYCATKAAVHSFTLSARELERERAAAAGSPPVRVVEVVPPAVDTDLGGPGLHTFGVPLGDFADAVFVVSYRSGVGGGGREAWVGAWGAPGGRG